MTNRRTTAHWQADLALAQLTARTGFEPVARPRLDAADVQQHLRDSGVTVHHAARMPTPRDGRQVVVVFLEEEAEQVELARAAAKRLPGVLDVVCSGYNRAVMYIIASPAHPDNAAHPDSAAHPERAGRPNGTGHPNGAGHPEGQARPGRNGYPENHSHRGSLTLPRGQAARDRPA
jgi:hypothetical protein